MRITGRKCPFMILALICFCHEVAWADELEDALENYADQSVSMSAVDDLARQRFYKTWLNDFILLSKKNKNSPYYSDVLEKSVALSNGLGEYDLSESLVKELMASQTDWVTQSRWYGELGEIRRTAYMNSKNMDDARLSNEYFEKQLAILDENKNSLNEAQMSDYVIHMGMLAEQIGKVDGDHARAADLYKKAGSYFNTFNDSQKAGLSSLRWDAEFFSGSEAVESIRANDMQRAMEIIRGLAKSNGGRHTASYYLNEVLNLRYPGGGEEYRGMVSKWLDENPGDSENPVLMFYLGRDYVRSGDYLKALEIYEKLRSDYWREIIRKDESALKSGKGGYSAEILINMAKGYIDIEAYEKAIRLLEEYEQLFPNDNRAGDARNMLTYSQKMLEEKTSGLLGDVNSDDRKIKRVDVAENVIKDIQNDHAPQKSVHDDSQSKTRNEPSSDNHRMLAAALGFMAFIGMIVFLLRKMKTRQTRC